MVAMCIYTIGVNADNKPTQSTQSNNKESSGTKLFNKLNPYLGTINAVADTIKNVASVVHTDSSTKIQGIHSQTGFERLSNIGDYLGSYVLIESIPQLVTNWKKRLSRGDIDLTPRQIESIMDDFDDYELSIKKEPALIMKQSLSYKNHEGNMVYLVYTIVPTSIDGMMFYSKFKAVTDFKVAQKYAIMTRSKCNIVKCKSVDYIQYIDTPISEEHWETIMRMNIKFIRTAQLLINGAALDNYLIEN